MNLSPPPLQTPITDPNALGGEGTPYLSQGLPTGDLMQAWSGWFNAVYQFLLAGGRATALPIALVANVTNTFTPSLTAGLFQRVVLAANSILLQTTESIPGGASTWTLIIDNPTAAMLTLTPDATYFVGFVIAVDTLTRAQITWTNDEHNRNSVSGSVFGNPIPP